MNVWWSSAVDVGLSIDVVSGLCKKMRQLITTQPRPSLAVKDLGLAEAVGYQPKCSSKSVTACFGVRGGRIIKCVYVVCRQCSAGNGERGDGEKRIIGKR